MKLVILLSLLCVTITYVNGQCSYSTPTTGAEIQACDATGLGDYDGYVQFGDSVSVSVNAVDALSSPVNLCWAGENPANTCAVPSDPLFNPDGLTDGWPSTSWATGESAVLNVDSLAQRWQRVCGPKTIVSAAYSGATILDLLFSLRHLDDPESYPDPRGQIERAIGGLYAKGILPFPHPTSNAKLLFGVSLGANDVCALGKVDKVVSVCTNSTLDAIPIAGIVDLTEDQSKLLDASGIVNVGDLFDKNNHCHTKPAVFALALDTTIKTIVSKYPNAQFLIGGVPKMSAVCRNANQVNCPMLIPGLLTPTPTFEGTYRSLWTTISGPPGANLFETTGICESVTGNNCVDNAVFTNIADAFTTYKKHNCAIKLTTLHAKLNSVTPKAFFNGNPSAFGFKTDETSCCDGFHVNLNGIKTFARNSFEGVNCADAGSNCCAEDDPLCNSFDTSTQYPRIGDSLDSDLLDDLENELLDDNNECRTLTPELYEILQLDEELGGSTFFASTAGVSTMSVMAVLAGLMIVTIMVRRRRQAKSFANESQSTVNLSTNVDEDSVTEDSTIDLEMVSQAVDFNEN